MSFSLKGISSPYKNKEHEVVGLKSIEWVCNYQSKKRKREKEKKKKKTREKYAKAPYGFPVRYKEP